MNSSPQINGDSMQVYRYDLKQQSEYHKILFLDPETATFEDIKKHALTKQNINSEQTITKYLNVAKLMETHPVFPVDFKHPSVENFFRYMDYLKLDEKVSVNVLNLRRKVWHMFCKAWGVYNQFPRYPIGKVPDRSKDIIIPTPETVHDILSFKYTSDKYLNKLIQYHYFIGFMIGMRPPNEMIILNIDDVYLDEPDNYLMTITEPKKNGNKRTIRIESNIAISKTRKSFKNYIDTIRPRFSNKSEDSLIINPETGKRWEKSDQLRYFLNYYAKNYVWGRYHPYIMRHWCATARCIEWKDDYTVLKRVKSWLGHKRLDTTEKYIDLASLYNQGKGSWLSRALKTIIYILWGMLGVTLERIRRINERFVQSIRDTVSVSLQVRLFYSCRFERNFLDFFPFVPHYDILSLNPFFSFYSRLGGYS